MPLYLILDVFTEKPYVHCKLFECTVVNISNNNIESRDVSDVKINIAFHNLIGRRAVPQLAEKLRVNVLLLQF